MALLVTTNGTVHDNPRAIAEILAPTGVRIETWPVPADPDLQSFLELPSLDPARSDDVLSLFHDRFDSLKTSLGYQSQDLVVLYPDLPGIDAMLDRFASCHTHADDEIRYVIEGEGVFGFVLPGGGQVELTMSAGDYINVPSGAEHWFRLTPKKRIKAIRYFTSREGWVPNYTGRTILPFPGATKNATTHRSSRN